MSRYFKKFKVYALRSLAVVLSAALAVTASCFSSGLIAQAATSSISASPSGYVSISYMSSWSDVYPDVVDSLDNGYNVTYNFPLQFGYSFSDSALGTWATGTIYVKVDFSVSYQNGDAVHENERFIGSAFSGSNYSVSYYPINNTSGYVVAVFDHFKITDHVIGGPTDWKISASRFTDVYTLGSMTLLASGAGNSITTDYSNSLADQIASGINASSDIDLILAHLSSIASNTQLLSQVLSKLDNLNLVLTNIYSEVQKGNQSLHTLVSALAGVDVSGMQLSAIQEAMYNNWVNIIRDAINKDAPDVSGVGDKQQSANDQLTSNDQLESQAFGFADNNISAIDFNIAFPGTVASSAVVVMSWLSLIWEKLGNLQFLVSATCLAGLLTIVLGVINKFVRSSKRD